MNSPATPSAISSPGLAAGLLPFVLRGGPTSDLFGRDHALANLSAAQAELAGLMTSGTYGPTSTISSASADLQRSLASRLQAATASCGSTLYALTWKDRAGPSGRPICALRASVRRTSDSGSTGWPTPNSAVVDAKPNPPITSGRRPTDPQIGTADIAVHLCGWPTGWPTCTVQDAHRGVADARPWDTGRPLGQIVALTRAEEPTRLTASGEMLTGSDAGMASGGQLNPAHSRWLMAYPAAWCEAAILAHRSIHQTARRKAA